MTKEQILTAIKNSELDNLRSDVARELEATGLISLTADLSNEQLINEINSTEVYDWLSYYVGYYNALNEIKILLTNNK